MFEFGFSAFTHENAFAPIGKLRRRTSLAIHWQLVGEGGRENSASLAHAGTTNLFFVIWSHNIDKIWAFIEIFAGNKQLNENQT